MLESELDKVMPVCRGIVPVILLPLAVSAAVALLQNKSLSGSEVQKQQLCDRYGNNPLALKMEYVTDQLIEQVCAELATDGITDVTDKLMTFTNNPSATSVTTSAATSAAKSAPLFLTYALIKTTVKDYIRESQCRLILGAIANQLRTTFTSPRAIEEQLQRILAQLRASETTLSGYGGGNLINLFNELQIDLTAYDFSGLTIWQAYLQKVNLHRVNLLDAPQLIHTGECLKTLHGHTDWVWSVTWHPDGQILASASQDQTIKLWDIHAGKCLKTLQGHTNWVRSVTWSRNIGLISCLKIPNPSTRQIGRSHKQ